MDPDIFGALGIPRPDGMPVPLASPYGVSPINDAPPGTPPVDPQSIANAAVAHGVPPPPLPPVGALPPGIQPDNASIPPLGQSLDPFGTRTPDKSQERAPLVPGQTGEMPMPQPRPQGDVLGQPAAAAAPGTVTPKPGNDLLSTLRGLTVPKPPTPQTIKTPDVAAPKATTPIKGGQLFALLEAMGMGGHVGGSGYKLPSTLGAALGGR